MWYFICLNYNKIGIGRLSDDGDKRNLHRSQLNKVKSYKAAVQFVLFISRKTCKKKRPGDDGVGKKPNIGHRINGKNPDENDKNNSYQKPPLWEKNKVG